MAIIERLHVQSYFEDVSPTELHYMEIFEAKLRHSALKHTEVDPDLEK